MKKTLNSLGASAVLIASMLCIGASYPSVTHATDVPTTYNIAASIGPNGSFSRISPDGYVFNAASGNANVPFDLINPGESLNFGFFPDTGYQVAGITVDGNSLGKLSSYAFNDINANHTLAISFEVIPEDQNQGGEASSTFNIAVSLGAHGSFSRILPDGYVFSASGGNSNVPFDLIKNGESLNFGFFPDALYQIADISVDGASQGTTTTYAFDSINANHTLAISFEIIPTDQKTDEPIATSTATTTPDAPVTPPVVPQVVNVSGSSYSSSGSSGSYILPLAAVTSTTTLKDACPLITSFMQLGSGSNDSGDVVKLQAFLKNTENMDVSLTGIFDTQTESAVRAFQAKYLSEVMGPWKVTNPSGYVYITTKRKINEISCNSVLNLTQQELATIDAYVRGNQNPPPVVGSNINSDETVDQTTPSATTTPIIGDTNNTSGANTASVGNAQAPERLWGFIKGIFGR